MAKPYSRTFRYSEETKKILDQYDGNFDELVHYAFFTIADQEEMLKSLKEESKHIADYNNQLLDERKKLKDDISKLYGVKSQLERIEACMQNLVAFMI